MAEVGESIVVVAYPEVTVTGVFNIGAPYIGGGGAVGGQNIQALMQQNRAAADRSVEIDSSAQEEQVTVVAQKMKELVFQTMAVMSSIVPTANIPCIGQKTYGQIRAMLGSVKFTVSDRDFGPNRAGENTANGQTSIIPVAINKEGLKGYDLLTGGLTYLLFHEIAHSFKEMRDFNKATFDSWYNATGKDIGSVNDKKVRDAFSFTDGFEEIEGRTNTIALALSKLFTNQAQIGFSPPYGYRSC